MHVTVRLTEREAAALTVVTPDDIAAAFPRGGYEGALNGARKIIASAVQRRRARLVELSRRKESESCSM
jgi:hypothetical protein